MSFPPIHIHGDSSAADLASFLRMLQNKIPKETLRLHPRQVAYKNEKEKHERPIHLDQQTMDDFKSNLDSVTVALKNSWRKETVFWLSSSDNRKWGQSNARKEVLHLMESDTKAFEEAQRVYDRGVAWHSYAIYFTSASDLYIYDPSHKPPGASAEKRRIRGMQFLTRANDFIQESRKGKNTKVKRFFVGGGGNDRCECQSMTADWLEKLVAAKAVGVELEMLKGWEELIL